jgi:hypothetical protein
LNNEVHDRKVTGRGTIGEINDLVTRCLVIELIAYIIARSFAYEGIDRIGGVPCAHYLRSYACERATNDPALYVARSRVTMGSTSAPSNSSHRIILLILGAYIESSVLVLDSACATLDGERSGLIIVDGGVGIKHH